MLDQIQYLGLVPFRLLAARKLGRERKNEGAGRGEARGERGSGKNYYTRTGPTQSQNRWWSLHACTPPLPQPQKMVSFSLHSHPPILRAVKGQVTMLTLAS